MTFQFTKLDTTFRKLPPDDKAAWLRALRSGKYDQGKFALRRDKYSPVGASSPYLFCCLGVYADAKGDAQWKAQRDEHDSYICQYSHLAFINPDLIDVGAQRILAAFNDGGAHGGQLVLLIGLEDTNKVKNDISTHGGSFEFDEIADWIEQNL